MKARHIIPLLFVSVMALVSCGKKNYYGSYSFQMGRDKGVHINATIELTPDAYETELIRDPKKYRLTLDLQTSETKEEEPADPEEPSYDEIIKMIYAIFGDGSAVEGYYAVGDIYEKDKRNLIMGFVLNSDTIAEAIKEIVGEDVPIPPIPTIDPELTQKLMFSLIDSKSVYFIIPVSIKDLVLQIYWYGYDVYFDGDIHVDTVEKHPLGSHPTQEEVDAINANPAYKEHHEGGLADAYPFRDYHTLTIGLLKN